MKSSREEDECHGQAHGVCVCVCERATPCESQRLIRHSSSVTSMAIPCALPAGLDSTCALSVMTYLRGLASGGIDQLYSPGACGEGGTAIVATIHQPRPCIWSKFDLVRARVGAPCKSVLVHPARASARTQAMSPGARCLEDSLGG